MSVNICIFGILYRYFWHKFFTWIISWSGYHPILVMEYGRFLISSFDRTRRFIVVDNFCYDWQIKSCITSGGIFTSRVSRVFNIRMRRLFTTRKRDILLHFGGLFSRVISRKSSFNRRTDVTRLAFSSSSILIFVLRSETM